MNKEQFKDQFVKQINLILEFNAKIDQLKDLGIDLIETPLCDIPMRLFDNYVETICTEQGSDIVFGWLYEDYKKDELNTVYKLCEYLNDNKYFIV